MVYTNFLDGIIMRDLVTKIKLLISKLICFLTDVCSSAMIKFYMMYCKSHKRYNLQLKYQSVGCIQQRKDKHNSPAVRTK